MDFERAQESILNQAKEMRSRRPQDPCVLEAADGKYVGPVRTVLLTSRNQILFYAHAGTAKEGSVSSSDGGGYISLYLSCEVGSVCILDAHSFDDYFSQHRRKKTLQLMAESTYSPQ